MNDNSVINIFKIDKPKICFIGDIHGDFKSLQGLMKKTGFRDTAYIVCGDVGFGFNKKEYYSQMFNKLTKTASKLNCEFIFIRGNHDDKTYFDKQLIHRKCFKTIPDYSVIQTPTNNILCIGGAISIDRMNRMVIRKQNILKTLCYKKCSESEAEKIVPKIYWEDEPCYYDEEKLSQLKLNNINIDIVCTHTCPSFVKPFGKENISHWLEIDNKLNEDIDNERNVMDSVYNKLKADGHTFDKWFYGHFHYHNVQIVDNVMFVMLDMCRSGNCDIYDVLDTKQNIWD